MRIPTCLYFHKYTAPVGWEAALSLLAVTHDDTQGTTYNNALSPICAVAVHEKATTNGAGKALRSLLRALLAGWGGWSRDRWSVDLVSACHVIKISRRSPAMASPVSRLCSCGGERATIMCMQNLSVYVCMS